MKNKDFVLTARTSYKFYRKNNEDPKALREYLDVLYGFFDYMRELILDGSKVALPERLGNMTIIGKKQKVIFDDEGNITNLNPDWKSTNELWSKCEECKEKKQLVYHFNEHTNRVLYKLLWSKSRVLVTNKGMYYFKPCRDFKRTLAKLIKEGKEYIINYG